MWKGTLWLAVSLAILAIVAAYLLSDPHPADACEEDGAWVAVDHHALDGVQDSHGVFRACRSIDDLIDTAFEVAIQNGEVRR